MTRKGSAPHNLLPPPSVTFEAQLAGGVVLLDASKALPGRWGPRAQPIERIYLHHSGAEGALGYRGFHRSARYSRERRGWRSTAYHYWIPAAEPIEAGPLIRVYRGNPDDAHTWHTGGAANGHGLSVCLQGNLRRHPPTPWQVEALEALIPWLQDLHAATLSADRWLSWHSESGEWGGSGKPTCPGPHVEQWAREWREAA